MAPPTPARFQHVETTRCGAVEALWASYPAAAAVHLIVMFDAMERAS